MVVNPVHYGGDTWLSKVSSSKRVTILMWICCGSIFKIKMRFILLFLFVGGLNCVCVQRKDIVRCIHEFSFVGTWTSARKLVLDDSVISSRNFVRKFPNVVEVTVQGSFKAQQCRVIDTIRSRFVRVEGCTQRKCSP